MGSRKTGPDIGTLFKLSQIFGVNMEEIIYGEKQNRVTNVTNITNQTIKNTAKREQASASHWQ